MLCVLLKMHEFGISESDAWPELDGGGSGWCGEGEWIGLQNRTMRVTRYLALIFGFSGDKLKYRIWKPRAGISTCLVQTRASVQIQQISARTPLTTSCCPCAATASAQHRWRCFWSYNICNRFLFAQGTHPSTVTSGTAHFSLLDSAHPP